MEGGVGVREYLESYTIEYLYENKFLKLNDWNCFITNNLNNTISICKSFCSALEITRLPRVNATPELLNPIISLHKFLPHSAALTETSS